MEDLGVWLNSFEIRIELSEQASGVPHCFNAEFCSNIGRMGSENTHVKIGCSYSNIESPIGPSELCRLCLVGYQPFLPKQHCPTLQRMIV